MTYRALVIHEPDFDARIEERETSGLPDGDLLIKVAYSSLNYKDALSATGNRGVTKHYPHTPGIDAAGTVAASQDPQFREGDEVIVTGFDLGMNTPGGFGEYIRVPAAWAVPLPGGLTLREAMVYGTAGLTAALALTRLEAAGVEPGRGQWLVTGASGGVGSLAVALLARAGATVAAATGSPANAAYLRSLGAGEIVDRRELEAESERPLLHGRWDAAVDTVGGTILSTLIKSLNYGGAVAVCGNVGSGELPTTVYPLILRGVSIMGVDSAGCPAGLRRLLWERLAGDWKVLSLPLRVTETGLGELHAVIERMLAGRLSGRVVVDLSR